LITLPIRKFEKSSIKQVNNGKIRRNGLLNRYIGALLIKVWIKENEKRNENNMGIKKIKRVDVIKIKLSRIK
jgi:hypothetical protein